MANSEQHAAASVNLVANALGVQGASVTTETRIGAFEPWDSLGHLRIMLALEDMLDRQLCAEEAIGIESVADIIQLLEAGSG